MNDTPTKECKFCLSEIPEAARKCRFCLEWVKPGQPAYMDEYTTSNSFSSRLSDLKKPLQLWLVHKIPIYNISAIIAICLLIFGVLQFSWYRLDEEVIYLYSFFLYTLQMIIAWYCVIWMYNLLHKNHHYFITIATISNAEAESKFTAFHKRIFRYRYSIIFGVIVGLSAAIGDHSIGTPFNTDPAKWMFGVFEFINMFFGGAAVYSMYSYSMFIYKISKIYTNEVMSLEQKLATKKIGAMHLKTSILAVCPLALGISAKIIGNWTINELVIIFYSVFALAIIIYIYWPMVNIHHMMKRDVDVQILAIQKKIRQKLNEIESNPSSSNFVKINELRKLEMATTRQNTWPFDPKSLWAIFLAVIFPIILMFLNKVLEA